jgi:hypothetical protein
MDPRVQAKWAWVDDVHGMRTQLLDVLNDSELSFTPGGENPTLGAIFQEMANVETSYAESLITFTQRWTPQDSDAAHTISVEQLKARFTQLDQEMLEALATFSDNELTSKTVTRSDGGEVTVDFQIDIYGHALLIFLGKVVVYFKTMTKPRPEKIAVWLD